MTWLEEQGDRHDAVMLLEPTSPFTRPFDYDNAIEMMLRLDANVIVGVRPVEVNSQFVGPLDPQGRLTSIVDKIVGQQNVRRQDVPQEYTMNGGLYLFKWEFFKANGSLYCDRHNTYGYVMEPAYSIEIDSLDDLHRAEFMIENRYVDLSFWKS